MQKVNLKYLLFLHKRVTDIDEKILTIKEQLSSPKAQVITDMPRNQSAENSIEKGFEKIMSLNEKRDYFYDRIASEWLIIEEVFKLCNISERRIELMRLRYFYGLKWDKCAKAMAKQYPKERWNDNKVFRIHRQVISICIENGYTVC